MLCAGVRWKLSLRSKLSRSLRTSRSCTKSSGRRLEFRSWLRVRLRIEVEDVAPDRAEQVRRDDVVRELLASHAARAAGEGVVEAEVRIGRRHLAEVAVAHPQRGHAVGGLRAPPRLVALPGRRRRTACCGRSVRRACRRRCCSRAAARARPNALLANVLALSSSWLRRKKPEPWNSLVPDLVTTVTAAPAGHALVGVEVVGGDVDGLDRLRGAARSRRGGAARCSPTPRRRCGTRCCCGCVPLTLVRSARPGVSISAFWNWAGVAPGTRFRRLW